MPQFPGRERGQQGFQAGCNVENALQMNCQIYVIFNFLVAFLIKT